MDTESVHNVHNIKDVGQAQYDKYVKERLEEQLFPVLNIIPQNNMAPLQKTFSQK